MEHYFIFQKIILLILFLITSKFIAQEYDTTYIDDKMITKINKVSLYIKGGMRFSETKMNDVKISTGISYGIDGIFHFGDGGELVLIIISGRQI